MAKTDRFEVLPHPNWLIRFLAPLAAALWITGIALSIVSYNQSNVIPYSLWNHFVSELGFPQASKLTWIVNATQTIGSLLALPVIYGLGARLRTRLGYAASGLGLVTFLILSGLGMLGLKYDFLRISYLPPEFIKAHIYAALVFFAGWLVTAALFTVAFCRQWKAPGSRFMAVAGVICCLVCLAFFVSLVWESRPTRAKIFTKDPIFRAIRHSQASPRMVYQWADAHRPRIMWVAIMEWSLVGSIFVWLGLGTAFIAVNPQGR